jgi:hypothetical protein
VTSTTTPGGTEQAASAARWQCICQEDPGNGPCACALPITREQADRLHTYATQHPERMIIMSEPQGAWMSALQDFLPPAPDGEDRVTAWMSNPRALPPAAGLRSSADLGELLDLLGAPPAPATL